MEKFYLGGLHYNPGYYSGEVTGDNALVGSAELQLNTAFDVTPFGWPASIGAQLFGFYDYGQAWQNSKLDANGWLASTGGGVRLSLTQYAEVDLLGVYRVQRRPVGTGPTIPPLKADAFYWRVLLQF